MLIILMVCFSYIKLDFNSLKEVDFKKVLNYLLESQTEVSCKHIGETKIYSLKYETFKIYPVKFENRLLIEGKG